jgi:hypothetical protein
MSNVRHFVEASNPFAKSSLRPTVPAPREAAFLSLSQFAFAAVALFLWPTWVGYGASALCFSVGAVFLVSVLVPSRFVRGIRTMPNGFELWRPLRKPLAIRYAELTRVVAVSRGEGDTSDELTFIVHTQRSRASIPEYDLHSTGAFDHVAALPGFKQDVLLLAMNHEATLLQAIIGKRFTVFEL